MEKNLLLHTWGKPLESFKTSHFQIFFRHIIPLQHVISFWHIIHCNERRAELCRAADAGICLRLKVFTLSQMFFEPQPNTHSTLVPLGLAKGQDYTKAFECQGPH